ncbi:MAG: hypothetical protein IAF02_17310 [Anaerolineae bacterium]|nr:hypothetical protein [Anaerolineae bacterium]
MNTKIMKTLKTPIPLWIFLTVFILSSCSIKPAINALHMLPKVSAPTPTPQAASWQEVGVYTESHSIMTAGFLDAQHIATGGVIGEMAYSSDGAATWLKTDSAADCRYGIEIVSPEVIWTCGGATHVRKSVDGGKTWQVLAAFGNPRTIANPCHSMSFLDENIGWLANSDLFGSTVDGGATWVMRDLPEQVEKIATIDTYLPGEGYLLDKNGGLYFTQDDGRHWREAGHLQPYLIKMSPSAYQLAAMRFSDAEHGLVVVSSGNSTKAGPIMAFHTSDGGVTWASEIVPVPTGPVYLSREGNFLTVISAVNQVTLLRYGE